MPPCPPVDNYHFASNADICLSEFPMDLYLCSSCGHAQLLDVVPAELLFGDYIYTSSSSPDLDTHFTEYVDSLCEDFALSEKSFVIDIGSNDGLFLSKFKSKGCKVMGVDPAEIPASLALARGLYKSGFLNDLIVSEILNEHGQADIVTANNVFSHNDDLRGFALNVRKLLKPTGVFVFEVSYLLSLVKNKVADYIYHEHLAHHSILPLKKFFESLGMAVVKVEDINTKGGSIRVFAKISNHDLVPDSSVDEFIRIEHSFNLYDPQTYFELQHFYDNRCLQINTALKNISSSGKLVVSYGASATATVLNRMCRIEEYISFIVDDNKKRQARLSPSGKNTSSRE